MSNKDIYPFWTYPGPSATPPRAKRWAKAGDLRARTLQTIKRDKKTGKYLKA
jgi:hypothetical protein